MIQGSDEYRKLVYRSVRNVARNDPAVGRYTGMSDENILDVLRFDDCPSHGATTWATIGLSLHSSGYELENGKDIRCEFIAGIGSEYDTFDNVLADCAFKIMEADWSVYPGNVHRDAVARVFPGLEMKHIMFHAPFLWRKGPKKLELEDMTITWLMAVPISDSELELRSAHGYEALADLLGTKKVDVFRLDRPSVA